MHCKNCGALLREGDNVCHVCATPINMSNNSPFEEVSNPATNEFMMPSNMMQSAPIDYSNQPLPKGVALDPVPEDGRNTNKEYVKRDGNDRVTATIFNFVTFAIIIIIVIIIISFLVGQIF